MNQTGKILLGIGAAAIVVMGLMKFGGGAQSVGRRRDPKKAAADLEEKEKPKVDPNAGKPEAIKAVRAALQGSSIDAFDGITDPQFGKLSTAELTALAKAIASQKKFTSESQWRQTDPQSFQTVMTSWTKITGKKISV